MTSRPAWRLLSGAAALGLFGVTTPALALNDGAGQPIPNTSPSTTAANIAAGPSIVTDGGLDLLLADPASPGDDTTGPVGCNTGATTTLRSPLSPEEDLLATLDRLASAPGATEADAERDRAIQILEGDPALADALDPTKPAVYAGMPLLNTGGAAMTRNVPAGGEVTVKVVRFGEHEMLDTRALTFADPTQPFTIRYRFVELGGSAGGMFTPAPILTGLEGGATRGLSSVAVQLGMPETETGTRERSRFTDLLLGPAEICGANEHTRLAVRDVVVNMPPAQYVTAVLHPNLRDGHQAAATIRASDAAMRPVALADLATSSPERQIHTAISVADPLAAKAAAAGVRAQVGAMRTKGRLPGGTHPHDPATADLTIAFVNNEVYASATSLHVPDGDTVRVRVQNWDRMGHTLEALDLQGGDQAFGPGAWGGFAWTAKQLGAASQIPAATEQSGGSVTPGVEDLVLSPSDDMFALWLSDPTSGPSAASLVKVSRGAKIESHQVTNTFDMPLHGVFDAAGAMWLTLPGSDSFGRLTAPGGDTTADISTWTFERFPIPGGIHDGQAPEGNFVPIDIAIDHKGILWATLSVGNAIARIDPTAVSPNTGDGITIFDLNSCNNNVDICRPPPLPAPPFPLSRMPTQLTVQPDGEGNTVVWFSEAAAGAIGLLRVTPAGVPLSASGDEVPNGKPIDIPCGGGCVAPFGVTLDRSGALWFTDAVGNRVGRMTPSQQRPFASSAMAIHHYPIPLPPNFEPVIDGELFIDPETRIPVPVLTAAPHSITTDPKGRVWFTELETGHVSMLDPQTAVAGSSQGLVQHEIPTNEFGGTPQPADLSTDRAGRVFVADEYGDAIVAATSLTGVDKSWRPIERQSLTDKPVSDHENNLWFLEAGSGIITRVRGVTAGVPLPVDPARYTADTKLNEVRAVGVTEIDTVDVQVTRPGKGVVASRTGVPVVAGAFTVGDATNPWQSAATGDPVRRGDTVRITPTGDMAPGPISFYVARLEVTPGAGANLPGAASHDGSPIYGSVVVEASGETAPLISKISPTGTFAVTLSSAPPAGLDGTISWTRALPVGLATTVSGIQPESADPDPTPPPPPPAPAPAPEPVVGPVATPQGDGSVATTPPARTTKPPAKKKARKVPVCGRIWVQRRGSRWIAPLLGATARRVEQCLGTPNRRIFRRGTLTLRYTRKVDVVLTKGRVRRLIIRSRALQSRPAVIQVGSVASRISRLRYLRTEKLSGGRLRTVLRLNRGFADVRLTVKKNRVRATTVTHAPSARALNPQGLVLARARR